MISKDKKRICVTISKESYDIICRFVGCYVYLIGDEKVRVTSKSEVVDALVKACGIR